ncbi:MAG: nuclear transport factor 2 family protein [Candidatus Omnitrophota bacterium]
MDRDFINRFAADWIEAWNAHDLERILSHYSDDFEMSSPVIPYFTNEPTGILRGKSAVGAYWGKALLLMPELKFELITVLAGVNSAVLYYKGVRGRFSAEVFYFGPDGKVIRANAHYS